MGLAGTKIGNGGRLVLAVGLAVIGFGLVALPTMAVAQFFDRTPLLRPPNDIPSVPPGPAQSIAPATFGEFRAHRM